MNWAPSGFLPNPEGFFPPNFQTLPKFSSHHEIDMSQQQKNDEDFINHFFKNKSILKYHNEKPIKISTAKSMLLNIMTQKKNIEAEIADLDVGDERFHEKIIKFKENLAETQEKINYFNQNIKLPLLKVLKKRNNKRKAIKIKKEKLKQLKKAQKFEIQEKHEIINKILNERLEEVEGIKHEAALKRQADIVLHEVRRKTHEAKKMLSLLKALGKLRDLRSKEEEKLGGYCSKQLTETFNKVMDRFQKLWEKQLEVYKLEEKGLKIMLEENTVPRIKISDEESNILQWEKALFGEVTNEAYAELVTAPEHNIETLIQIRRDWDQFITSESTPMASSIPLGWVLPPETDDEFWKAFKVTKTI